MLEEAERRKCQAVASPQDAEKGTGSIEEKWLRKVGETIVFS